MSRRTWAWARVLGGVAILAVIVWRVGAGSILDGLRTVNVWTLLVGTAIAAVTTASMAWRWSLVAHGLGVGVPLRAAIAAYYRSQFLNTTLPGGVLGDLHRGVSHGRDVGSVGHGLRAVAWERTAGQVVQVTLTLIVLVALPSPVRRYLAIVLPALVVAAVITLLVVRALPHSGDSRLARIVRTTRADVRHGVLARSVWPGVVLTSTIMVAGYAATFLVAAHTAGTHASTGKLLPIAMLILVAMTVPTNIGGWGPREGAAAALFGAAGLGAGHGVAASTVYGVMGFVATLPGAGVLVWAWLRRRRHPTDDPPQRSDSAVPRGVQPTGAQPTDAKAGL
jgi:uncharacterized membrane protein YbhN (UPF0104 family)